LSGPSGHPLRRVRRRRSESHIGPPGAAVGAVGGTSVMGTSHWVRTTVSRMSSVSPGVASRPFGMSAHVRRPGVLMLVLRIFLMIVGVTATAQAAMVSAHFSTNTLSSIVGTDTALVRALVRSFVSPDDFGSGTLPVDRTAIVERQLKTLVTPGTILRVEVRRPDGTVIFADDPALRGASPAPSDAFARAGIAASAVVDIVDVAASGTAGPALATTTVVREYFPL